jgi:ribosomal protein S18 acetylase RimI-like enzyme
VEVEEVSILSNLAKHTFRQTYAAYNREENLEEYIRRQFNVDNMLKEISTPGVVCYFVCVEHHAVGYCMLNERGKCPLSEIGDAIEIKRIYIDEHFKGYGAGSLLLETCKRYTLNRTYNCHWLCVWENNANAIAFYKRRGFTICGHTTFQLGGDVQKDYVMIRKLGV